MKSLRVRKYKSQGFLVEIFVSFFNFIEAILISETHLSSLALARFAWIFLSQVLPFAPLIHKTLIMYDFCVWTGWELSWENYWTSGPCGIQRSCHTKIQRKLKLVIGSRWYSISSPLSFSFFIQFFQKNTRTMEQSKHFFEAFINYPQLVPLATNPLACFFLVSHKQFEYAWREWLSWGLNAYGYKVCSFLYILYNVEFCWLFQLPNR